jgi:hypothetical protein
MQAALFSGQGILPELPGAIHLESGKLCQHRMPAVNALAPFAADTVLAVYVYWDVRPLAR